MAFLEKNKIYLGDCLEIMKDIQDTISGLCDLRPSLSNNKQLLGYNYPL